MLKVGVLYSKEINIAIIAPMKLPATLPYPLLVVPLLIAMLFSAFIYWEAVHCTSWVLNTLSGLIAIYGLLVAPRKMLPIAGFWIGLLWFYWIGYSFTYYDMDWAKWPVALGFGVVYALYFGVLGLTSSPWLRAGMLFGLTFFWPMDFNWMQPEVIFVESYIGVEKWQFALVLALLAASAWFKGKNKAFPLLMLVVTFHAPYTPPPLPSLKIKLVSTELSQDMKWKQSTLQRIVGDNLRAINDAIDKRYDMVVLPEAAFPLFMNHNPQLMAFLQEKSHHITILTGTLHEENHLNYNVSYLFDEGNITVAKKTILVPFGEYIPLPSFLKQWVDDHVYQGAANFVTAKHPTDFEIQGVTFRNAICYEITREELYDPKVHYMVAMSNNGWFTPSIQPTLQNLLIRLYVRRNHAMVFHSANSGGSGVVY